LWSRVYVFTTVLEAADSGQDGVVGG
jgi:hypothetical protein